MRKSSAKAPAYYPLFLDLRGRRCVVVGGGRVAQRKVKGLLEAQAQVVVVAPEASRALCRWASTGRIRLRQRPYRRADLRGAALVMVATDEAALNARVAQDAEAMGIPVNVADAPGLCTFIVPSVLRRGPLTVAISTSGASPALAATIRRELEGLYPPQLGAYLRRLAALRKELLKGLAARERQGLLKRLGSARALGALRGGQDPFKEVLK